MYKWRHRLPHSTTVETCELFPYESVIEIGGLYDANERLRVKRYTGYERKGEDLNGITVYPIRRIRQYATDISREIANITGGSGTASGLHDLWIRSCNAIRKAKAIVNNYFGN